MKFVVYLTALFTSSLVGADQLDLSMPDHFSASQIDSVSKNSEIILLARHPQEAPFKTKRVASNAAASNAPINLPVKKNDKSVLPSILACGLLGMSMYGNNSDSGAWRAGSAVLCGVSLAWYND